MTAEERPGWSFMPAEDHRDGDTDDTVEGFMEESNLGVRGHGTTWRVIHIDEDEVLTVEDTVYTSVEQAMDEVEWRQRGGNTG